MYDTLLEDFDNEATRTRVAPKNFDDVVEDTAVPTGIDVDDNDVDDVPGRKDDDKLANDELTPGLTMRNRGQMIRSGCI